MATNEFKTSIKNLWKNVLVEKVSRPMTPMAHAVSADIFSSGSAKFVRIGTEEEDSIGKNSAEEKGVGALSKSVYLMKSPSLETPLESYSPESIADIHGDILTYVFSFIQFQDFKEVCRLSHVCKSFRLVLESKYFWDGIHPVLVKDFQYLERGDKKLIEENPTWDHFALLHSRNESEKRATCRVRDLKHKVCVPFRFFYSLVVPFLICCAFLITSITFSLLIYKPTVEEGIVPDDPISWFLCFLPMLIVVVPGFVVMLLSIFIDHTFALPKFLKYQKKWGKRTRRSSGGTYYAYCIVVSGLFIPLVFFSAFLSGFTNHKAPYSVCFIPIFVFPCLLCYACCCFPSLGLQGMVKAMETQKPMRTFTGAICCVLTFVLVQTLLIGLKLDGVIGSFDGVWAVVLIPTLIVVVCGSCCLCCGLCAFSCYDLETDEFLKEDFDDYSKWQCCKIFYCGCCISWAKTLCLCSPTVVFLILFILTLNGTIDTPLVFVFIPFYVAFIFCASFIFWVYYWCIKCNWTNLETYSFKWYTPIYHRGLLSDFYMSDFEQSSDNTEEQILEEDQNENPSTDEDNTTDDDGEDEDDTQDDMEEGNEGDEGEDDDEEDDYEVQNE